MAKEEIKYGYLNRNLSMNNNKRYINNIYQISFNLLKMINILLIVGLNLIGLNLKCKRIFYGYYLQS